MIAFEKRYNEDPSPLHLLILSVSSIHHNCQIAKKKAVISSAAAERGILFLA